MALSALEQHCIDELRHMYGCHQRLKAVLPRVVLKAMDIEVKTVLTEHMTHLERLGFQEVFERMDATLEFGTGSVYDALFMRLDHRVLERGHDPHLIDAMLLQSVVEIEELLVVDLRFAGIWLRELGHPEAAEILLENARRFADLAEELVALAPEVPIEYAEPGAADEFPQSPG